MQSWPSEINIDDRGDVDNALRVEDVFPRLALRRVKTEVSRASNISG
jgi:hypothetical protein